MNELLKLITDTLKDNAVKVQGLATKLDGSVIRVKIVKDPPFIRIINEEGNKK